MRYYQLLSIVPIWIEIAESAQTKVSNQQSLISNSAAKSHLQLLLIRDDLSFCYLDGLNVLVSTIEYRANLNWNRQSCTNEEYLSYKAFGQTQQLSLIYNDYNEVSSIFFW